ncbi:hypothetical protein EJV46_03810 [Roseococcus sp. SYP-B2431]|uniref:autotransporter-associated beta strand repeat-containing protein n=1 Tax=Roseococcus sp. SYP-B2431 TaxID=2496640 RepID=UPI00103EE2D0|nr:autotransporter-associated beta strand repeat-containing protein [Roseococcus sp. SYP-B2431]TCH99805.1 hypothetical protein EJV46_03810 [Roseococcus sp. SYP-B2431]
MAVNYGLGAALRASTALIGANLLPRSSSALIPAVLLTLGAAAPALGQNWQGPGTDFNTGANWSTGTIPGVGDTAVFQNAGPTSLSTSLNTSLAGIRFDAGAASYNLTLGNDMTLVGSVVNNSGAGQTIGVANGTTLFFQGAAASGQGVEYIVDGALIFDNNSTGGNSSFVVNSQVAIRDAARTVAMGSLSGGGGTLVQSYAGGDVTLQVGSLGTSTSFGGSILSPGGNMLDLEKVGAGTLTLSGANSYGATAISAGTLQVGAGGTTGTLGTGAVVNNAALIFDRSDSVTVANAISGSGTVEQAGTGTTILTGGNSYSGTTTISAGTLQIGAGGGLTGTLGTGNVVNNGSLVFDRNSIDVSNVISGTGSVTIQGSTSLSGVNTYSGGTFINSFLFVAADSALGDAAGRLTFDRGFLTTTASFTSSRDITINAGGASFEPMLGATLALTGVISGSGGLGSNGPGTLVLTGANTYSGDTELNAGITQIAADDALGSGARLYINGGALRTTASLTMTRAIELQTLAGSNLTPDAGTTLTLAGAVSGRGLIMSGAGTLVLTGANSYGDTIISSGTLRVGNGGATGTLGSGAVTNDAALIFNRTGTLAVVGAISGTGTLEQAGTGTTILTGANTYSGATTISGGTLQVGNGGSEGSLGSGAVVNSSLLTFNRSDDALVVANAISGSGGLRQAGSGVVTLSGANTYSGGTAIDAGILAIGDIGALGSGAVTFGGGALRSNVTGSLSNTLAVIGAPTATISAAAGQTLTLTGALVASSTALVFGSATDSGVVAAGFGSATQGSPAVSLRVAGGTLRVDSNAFGTLLSTFSGTTIDSSATLDVNGRTGDFGTIANLQGAGTLTSTAEITVLAGSFAGAITGAAGLQKTAGGTLVLTGTNTYSGTTRILNGTLQIGDGGSTGTLGSGAVVLGNILAFNRDDDALVVANAISGTGRIRQIGTGTTTLTGALTYTGTTSVEAGTLVLGDALNAVNLPGAATIASTGTLRLQNGSLGSGTITNDGNLEVGLTATAGSATIVNNCCLRFSGSATAGTAAITNSAAGNIDFDETSTAGGASIANSGFVRFLADSSGGAAAYTGLAGSTVDFSWMSGTATTLGSLAGTGAVDVGSITLSVGGDGTSTTFAGVIADGGVLGGVGAGLTKVGAGTLTLTGANTYTGLTTISAGTLQVGNGGTTGALGSGDIVNNAALVYNRSDAVALDQMISGSGTLTQAGTGNLIVTGTNSYTGATFVNAGRLSVNGSIASSSGVTVASGATLGGTGSLPGVSVLSGGTIAPGNSIGTLSVAGNLTLAPGSTTQIEVQGPSIDRINVTGTAALGGTLQLLAQGGAYTFNAPYTIVQAGAVTGNFAAVNATGSFGAGVTSTVSTTASEAQLVLTPAPLVPIITPTDPVVPPPVPPPAVSSAPVIGPRGTANQISIAAGLDRAVASGADVSPLFPLYNLPASALPRGLDQVSGQIHAVAPGMHARSAYQFLGTILEPGRGQGLGDGYDGAAPRYAVWASGFGGGGRIGSSGNVGTYAATASGGGVAVGTDVRLNAQVVAGMALAGSGAMTRLSDSMGRAETSQIQGAIYGTGTFGALRLSAAVAYGGMDVTTRRSVPFLGLGDIRGRYTSSGVSTRLEAGWRLEGIVPRVALTPSVAFQGSWYAAPGFSETAAGGQGAAALAVAGRNTGQSRMELSLRADMTLTPTLSGFGRVGWAAYLQRDAGMSARFIGLPGSGFSLSGARPDAHAALVSGGVDWRVSPGMTLTTRLDAELAANGYAVNGTARLRYEF